MGRLKLEFGSARSRVGVREHALVGQHLLEHFALGAVAEWILFKRFGPHEPIGRTADVVSSGSIFDSAEFEPEDRETEAILQPPLTFACERIGAGMLGRRVREEDHIATVCLKKALFREQKGQCS